MQGHPDHGQDIKGTTLHGWVYEPSAAQLLIVSRYYSLRGWRVTLNAAHSLLAFLSPARYKIAGFRLTGG
jgi:hypothetical protein